MLIILPPSETKRPPPADGPGLDLDRLSFPGLNPTRRQVLAALVRTSGQPDAFERLRVRPTLVEHVLRNTVLDEVPVRAAAETYAGPFYGGLDFESLNPAQRERTNSCAVIASALFGLLRASDPVPAYRLHVCARLSGIKRIEPLWRPLIGDVLADAAGNEGVILDLRSPAYQAIGKPRDMAERTVTLRILPEGGARSVGDVVAKRTRGEVARCLVEATRAPATPDELASLLDDRWPVRLDPPGTPTRPWLLSLRPAG